jgi:alpha-glucosidase
MRSLLCFLLLVSLASGLSAKIKDPQLEVSSPDRRIQVVFQLKGGAAFYTVNKNKTQIVQPSRLGFVLKDAPALDQNFVVKSSSVSTVDEMWNQPWGEVKTIRNNYNSLVINLEEKSAPKRRLTVEFRVYDDGLGFRYQFPQQPNLKDFVIMDELTEFALANDHHVWWIPAYGSEMDSEYLYRSSSLQSINEKMTTPATLDLGDSLFLSIHEAALVDYPGMALHRQKDNKLKCDLVPWSDGTKAKVSAPFNTPWRTLQIANQAIDLIASHLILNLNEPNSLKDVSWIKPGKYNGIWWGMHLKTNTWEFGPAHGASNENVKRYIDFAAKHKLSGVLVEGWNLGWEDNWAVKGNFSFTKSYPDYNLPELVEYAKAKNVGLIAHHETGGNIPNYENQMEEAFKLLADNGIHSLKTGYVNSLPAGERHQSQYMVRHYQKVVDIAAKNKVMVDMHEPVKDTGLRRTYPNLMTREGVRGTEYEAWSDGNPPSHTAILPFTRGLAGPIDYTPGIFNITWNDPQHRVHTTLAKQLALYVVIYSPFQMAADLPENYEGHPAFQFIEDVPTDWEETKILNGKIGEYITTVRKDRNSNNWYLGSITNEQARLLDVKLDFLTPGKNYKAQIYQDGQEAHFDTNPLPIEFYPLEVTSASTLQLDLKPGGGTAIRFYEIN